MLLRVRSRLENVRHRCVVAEPGDEDRTQRLRRNGHASVALEETTNPLRPRRALHRPIESRLRRMEEIRRVTVYLECKQPRVLVEDGRELIGQRGGKWAVEAGRLVPIALVGQVHHPAAAAGLLLERVPKTKLADAAHAVRGDERQQREGGAIAQQIALVGRRSTALAQSCELVGGGDASLLHLFPLHPAANALLVELLRLGGLLRLAAQVDELSQRVGVHGQQRVVWREVGVAV